MGILIIPFPISLRINVPLNIQSVSISSDLELDEEELTSSSESNHSPSNHTTPQQLAQSGGYDDLISFDAFSPPQNAQQQQQSVQSANDDLWGGFNPNIAVQKQTKSADFGDPFGAVVQHSDAPTQSIEVIVPLQMRIDRFTMT